MNQFLAPNGKPSNLTPEQYKLVRSPEFKAWFGDWENLAFTKINDSGIDEISLKRLEDGVSKVFDSNGEPLPVYHGTDNDFNTFDKSKIGLNHWQSKSDLYGGGFFFTDKKNKAFRGNIKEVFLKIEKPLLNVFEDKYGYEVDYYHATDNFDLNSTIYFQKANENGNDGIIIKTKRGSLYVAFEPNQIKLADGTNTSFDGNNPDIRYAKGGLIAPNGKPSGLYFTEIYNLVRTKEFKNWFGDWEEAYKTKDYEGVSKIIDENGEPLICVHNTPNEFYEFDENEIGRTTDAGYYGKGFYFTPNVGQSRYGEIELNCFLNIKNPYFKQSSYRNYELNSDELKNQSYDGVVVYPNWIENMSFENGVNGSEEIVAYYPEQIKLGDGRNTTFDNYNADIRFDEGGEPQLNEEAQQYIDIISMNPKLEKYQKYKVILKDKFGIDFDSIYKDQEYIDNANLNDIKKQDDFLDFGNWLDYAKIISKKRGFIPMNLYDTSSNKYKLTDEIWSETSKKLNFYIKKVPYEERGTDGGDIARAFGNTIYYTEYADFYYFLHELGHIYNFQNNIEGIIKNPAYSPTNYGTTNSGETFAENFAIYFINPMALKNWNEDVYNAMDSEINEKYKNEINRIMPKNKDITFENGGDVIINPTEIECHKCHWHWKVKDGGNDLFICHKCNYDNSKYYKFEGLEGEKILDTISYDKGGQILNLNQIRKGQYEAKSNEIEIYLTNPKVLNGTGTNKWQLVILYGNDSVVNEWFDTKNEALKKGAYLLNDFLDNNFKKGGRTIAQTPAPKKDRIYGSENNKPESSKDISSAKQIKFSDELIETIKNKVNSHNKKYPNKQITIESAKAVVRRGMGAYSKSHRPTIKGGNPNSRVAWGLARLNAFLYKIVNGKSKSGKYSQDNDLIEELGYDVEKYEIGGENDEPTEFWGTEAGGVLVYCSTTERYLILLRSEWVLEPNTWGIISSKLDDDETNVEDAVLREAKEETGQELSDLIPSFIFEKTNFKFHNFVSIVEEEFTSELDWENSDYRWVKLDEMPENLHFGLKLLLQKEDLPTLVEKNKNIINKNQMDKNSFNTPLLIRLFELMREEVKSDVALHEIVENIMEIRSKGTLTMSDYDSIVGNVLDSEDNQNTEVVEEEKMAEGGKVESIHSNKGDVKISLDENWYSDDTDVELVPVSELIKFREFDRKVTPKYNKDNSVDNINHLKFMFQKDGVKSPLIIEYSDEDKAVLIIEGNHRLNSAIDLGMEYLPARVVLKKYGKYSPEKIKNAMKVSGFKGDQYGYIPSNMKPSKVGIAGTMPIYAEGGIIEGRLHSECGDDGCGRKFQVGENGHVIEAERDEAVIVADAFEDNQEYTIKGTPSEVASALNVLGGGKNFDKGAEIIKNGQELEIPELKKQAVDTDVDDIIDTSSIIINRRSMADEKQYEVTGTPKQIASAINSINGNGVVIEQGAEIKEN
jgi:8-oxo-dGTP pyrophosphatase MutT (NUDIX family)